MRNKYLSSAIKVEVLEHKKLREFILCSLKIKLYL